VSRAHTLDFGLILEIVADNSNFHGSTLELWLLDFELRVRSFESKAALFSISCRNLRGGAVGTLHHVLFHDVLFDNPHIGHLAPCWDTCHSEVVSLMH
jgi:hypothetical protein